jgi:group II intron reverse transcriptase/maturase
MEQILHPENIEQAWKNVKKNRGAPGVDGVTVDDFPEWRASHWSSISAKLRSGKYKPYPVKRVEIPKPDGGVRLLGIPTVLDRVIQQAMLQVLQPMIDPGFSDHSYGFRPRRSAHDAVREAKAYVETGCDWVVDLDIEKFFDRVNHDVLMSRVARLVDDKGVLRLIRRYLQSGIMVEGVCVRSEEGVPQGGPLSPLLANIILDDLDRELERRGHKFVRYADDCNIYVRSEEAGKRVFESITRFLSDRLRLRVNRQKSDVGRPWSLSFLGFMVLRTPEGFELQVSAKSEHRFRERVRSMMRRARGQSLDNTITELNLFIRGWFGYYGIAGLPSVFDRLDGWVRRRLRCVLWRQWKCAKTRIRRLLARGVPRNLAVRAGASSRGPWHQAISYACHKALGIAFFVKSGLFTMLLKWR